jgi:hypothetical protein
MHIREKTGSLQRHFFVNHAYGGCANDAGWFVVIDNTNNVCSWENRGTPPLFLYSTWPTYSNWNIGKLLIQYEENRMNLCVIIMCIFERI